MDVLIGARQAQRSLLLFRCDGQALAAAVRETCDKLARAHRLPAGASTVRGLTDHDVVLVIPEFLVNAGEDLVDGFARMVLVAVLGDVKVLAYSPHVMNNTQYAECSLCADAA